MVVHYSEKWLHLLLLKLMDENWLLLLIYKSCPVTYKSCQRESEINYYSWFLSCGTSWWIKCIFTKIDTNCSFWKENNNRFRSDSLLHNYKIVKVIKLLKKLPQRILGDFFMIIIITFIVITLMKDDHGSYIRNFCSCEQKAWKKFSQANWEQVVELVRYKPVKGWWCVYNCDDHPSFNSSLHSSHIWFSRNIQNFIIFTITFIYLFI